MLCLKTYSGFDKLFLFLSEISSLKIMICSNKKTLRSWNWSFSDLVCTLCSATSRLSWSNSFPWAIILPWTNITIIHTSLQNHLPLCKYIIFNQQTTDVILLASTLTSINKQQIRYFLQALKLLLTNNRYNTSREHLNFNQQITDTILLASNYLQPKKKTIILLSGTIT